MSSKVKKILLEEAAALSNDPSFKRLQKDNPITDTVIIFGFQNGHIHSVLPEDPVAGNMLKTVLSGTLGIDFPTLIPTEDPTTVKLPRRIVFHNRQAIGDILMFTCSVRDFKAAYPDIEVQVRSTAMHIWDYNPHLNNDVWPEVIDPMRYWQNKKDKPNPEQMKQMAEHAIKAANEEDKPVLLYIGPGKLTNASNRKDLHFSNAYRMSIEALLGVQIPQGPIRSDIHMTQSEFDAPAIIEPPYWLITAGEKGDWTCKTFPFAKWQEVVEKLPNIKFVQLGSTGHKHPELKGDNVVNFIGQTQDRDAGIRMLFNLFNHCEGSMGLVSFQMHLAAAFNKPCVVIAGAREPVHFTRYPGQQYLASDGCLPCTIRKDDSPTACWYCKIERCPYHTKYGGQEVPLCSDLFSSDDVVRAIMRYYDGGRLSFDKPVGRSLLVNRVKGLVSETKGGLVKGGNVPALISNDTVVPKVTTAKDISILNKLDPEEIDSFLSSPEGRQVFINSLKGKQAEVKEPEVVDTEKRCEVVEPEVEVELDKTNLWGFEFGGGSITDRDWEFMQGIIKENNVKTVLEFGAGLSTLLLNDLRLDVITYETNPGWIEKIKGINPKCDVVQWDGTVVPAILPDGQKPKYDLAFVDGPPGGQSREFSTKYGSNHADVVIVHDAGREWEKKWQEKYLEPNFYLASKGGHRCHLWRRGQLEKVVLDTSKPLIKVVFNGRGEGGAERSVCWIMDQFVKRGYAVQYISPNPQPCGTFRRKPIDGVVFESNLDLIKYPCDILFLYTNDWVWEFPKLAEYFEYYGAKRKVMAVNYKAGSIKKLAWCREWDHYLFLNSTLREQTGQHGTVMAPPTDISMYLDNQPNYEGNLKIVRHSSQGDTKYPKCVTDQKNEVVSIGFNKMLSRILEEIPDSEIFLMPAPSFLKIPDGCENRVHVHKRNQPPVVDFLKQGNVFWYKLPEGGYSEGGPKVIMEAQASGLPVIADNHSGAIDRLTYTSGVSGFLCNNFEEHLSALKELAKDPGLRKVMGNNARLHAKKMYDPQRWIDQIIEGFPIRTQPIGIGEVKMVDL